MRILVTGKLSGIFFNIIIENFRMISCDELPALPRPDLLKIIDKYDALVTRSETAVDREILDKARNLKVIIRAAVGTDNIDVGYASQKGILVVNCPNDNIISTAEHTFALMFAAARNILPANAALKQGIWEREKFSGMELRGKIVGIIGLGRVGGKVAELAGSMGMSVIAYDPYIGSEKFRAKGAVRMADLAQLLEQADIITIHTPKNDETFGMIGEQELQRTKKGVIIINCARSGIVNEKALEGMLDSGHVYAAGIDVWENEPPGNSGLHKHPGVIATPHIGASTGEAQVRIARTAAEQLCKVFKGEPPDYPVNMPLKITGDVTPLLII